MLMAALILLLLGVPLQLAYCARLALKPAADNRLWFILAMLGGILNISSAALLRDPLLATGQAAVLGIYFFTRPRKPTSPSSHDEE